MNNLEAVQATNELQKYLRKWKENGTRIYCDEDGPPRYDCLLPKLEELYEKGADLQYLERERGFAVIPHVFWCKELIKFFIDRGLNVNSRDDNGETALHLAIRQIYFGLKYDSPEHILHDDDLVEVVKFLLEQSADPRVTNLRGETVLLAQANYELTIPENELTRKLSKILLMEREDGGTTTSDDDEIVSNRHRIIDQFIHASEGGKTSSSINSVTQLMVAALGNKLDYCRLLVEMGADEVNTRDVKGYTALHYAAFNGANECAEFLAQKGADPNLKTASGKDAYDLGCYYHNDRDRLFTLGATPAKQAEMYEIAGAMEVMDNKLACISISTSFKLCDKAMDICKNYNLQPTQEFLANYSFLVEIQNNHPYFFDLHRNTTEVEQLRLSAINTVLRLSDETHKFWYLLSLLSPMMDSLLRCEIEGRSRYTYLFRYLNILSRQIKSGNEDATWFDEADSKSLQVLVRVMDDCLNEVLYSCNYTAVMSDRIKQFHSFAHLVMACLKKQACLTESKNNLSRTCMDICVNLCQALMILHSKPNYVFIPKKLLKDNERLLRTLFELDFRNELSGNSLIHRILSNHEKYRPDSVLALLDSDFVNVTVRNWKGTEPIQLMTFYHNEDLSHYDYELLFVKFANKGAHMDARNVSNGPTLREVLQCKLNRKNQKSILPYQYDTLKCACARVLAKSLVPYRNRAPKKIVDFILAHMP